MSEPIAIITKNASERLHVGLDEFRGYRLVQQRVYFDAGGGDYRPGKQGLSIRVEQLDGLIEALNAVRGEAVRFGWLEA